MSLIITRNFKRAKAQDAAAKDAKFQKGDKVRVWQYPVYGKLGEVVEATNGSMEYTVNVEGKDYPRIDYRRIVKVSNTAGDAAEFHVGQKVKHTRFGTIGKVFEIAPDGGIGVQWSNGQAYYGEFHRPLSEIVAVDACGKGEDAEACDAFATVKSLNAIEDAISAIKSAMDKVRSAYAVYCGEIGREKPKANVKDGNNYTFKALEEAKSAARGWYRSLYNSQGVF